MDRGNDVILVTRLNGQPFALNPDLVERAECTPDTVVTLVDGTKYVVAESVQDLVRLVREYRASVISCAQVLDEALQDDIAELNERRRAHGETTVSLVPDQQARPNVVVPLPVREA